MKQTASIRDLLPVSFETIDALRAQKMPASTANAINGQIRAAIALKRLEIEGYKMSGSKPPEDFLGIADAPK